MRSARSSRPRIWSISMVALLTGLARQQLLGPGCDPRSSPAKPAARPGPTIVIGAQDFRENRILAQVYAKGLKAAGFKAKVHRIKGFRQEAIDAAVNGDVNMLIEYAASFLEFLNGFRGFSSENVAITVDLVQGYLAAEGAARSAPRRPRTRTSSSSLRRRRGASADQVE